MQHFAYFLGRFHVLALHLPITLVLVVVVLEWYRWRRERVEFEPALRALWAATAVSAVLTATLGYLHFSEGGFTGSSAYLHRALGTTLAAAICLAWVLRIKRESLFRVLSPAIGMTLLMLVTLTGHFGGNLTHGSTFLIEYGPTALRRLAGLDEQRPPVRVLGEADPYLDVVRPMLLSHCGSCHNRDKQRGGLDLSSYAAMLKGGEDGAVMMPGNAQGSDIIRRVSIVPGDEDFMPKEGKTPLSANQVAILSWWIDTGARTSVRLSTIQVPSAIGTLIDAQVRAPSGPSRVASADSPGDAGPTTIRAQSADPKLLTELAALGLLARQVSQGDAHLVVRPIAAGSLFTASQIKQLADLGAGQIVELDLRKAALDGASVAALANLRELQYLRLDQNRLADADLRPLSRLTHLQVLGLYGNTALTDACLSTLEQMPSLQRVYLWQTHVSAAGAEHTRTRKPGLTIDLGDLGEAATSAQTASQGLSDAG